MCSVVGEEVSRQQILVRHPVLCIGTLGLYTFVVYSRTNPRNPFWVEDYNLSSEPCRGAPSRRGVDPQTRYPPVPPTSETVVLRETPGSDTTLVYISCGGKTLPNRLSGSCPITCLGSGDLDE